MYDDGLKQIRTVQEFADIACCRPEPRIQLLIINNNRTAHNERVIRLGSNAPIGVFDSGMGGISVVTDP